MAAGFAQTPDPACVSSALTFVGSFQDRAQERLILLPSNPLLRELARGPSGLESIAEHPTVAAGNGIAETEAGLGLVAAAVAGLSTCFPVGGAFVFPAGLPGFIENLTSAIDAAVNEPRAVNVNTPLLNATAAIRPELTAGEPRHGVDVQIDLAESLRLRRATSLVELPVPFTVENWTTYLVKAWLNVTVVNETGVPGPTETKMTVTEPGSYAIPVNLNLQYGFRYKIVLTAVDDLGALSRDEIEILADDQAPVVTETVLPLVYTNLAAVPTEWELHDEMSGVWSVTLSLDGVTIATLPASQIGETDPVEFAASVDVSSLVNGETATLTLIVEDRAGTEVMLMYDITRDLTAPTVLGTVHNLRNDGVLIIPYLNSTVRGWDNVSGFASYRVWYHNETSGADVEIHNQTAAGGIHDTTGLANFTKPWFNVTYRLNVSARDRAGNWKNASLDAADVQIAAKVVPRIPGYLYQDVGDKLPLNASTTIPAYVGVGVERVTVKVIRVDNGTAVFTKTELSFVGNVTGIWNASAAAAGEYKVAYELRNGRARTYLNQTVNVTQTFEGARKIVAHRTYGSLSGSGDDDVFRIQFDNSCGDDFTVSLYGYGKTLKLYWQSGEPGIHKNDPAKYVLDETSTTPSKTFTGPANGSVWSILVKTSDAGDVPYYLTYNRGCGGNQNEPPPVEIDIPPPPIELGD